MKRQFALVVACLLATAMSGLLHAATDPASGDTKLHLEACTKWSEQNGSFGTMNRCGEPVALLFIQLNGQHRFERVVAPNDRFETGVSEKAVKATGWLFTACPAGYVPNVPFVVENREAILKGQYECVRK
jgi:hypothetical protein